MEQKFPASVTGQVSRSPVTTLLDGVVFNDVLSSQNSGQVDCAGFREFVLYLTMLSASTPTDIQFIPQFSNDGGTTWFSYLQGPWASMFFEDAVMSSEITEAYSGLVVGRLFRLRAVATGTTSSATFTVTASVEFRS